MKKHFLILTLFVSLLFVNSVLAAGSVTIGYQVLDSSIRPGGETTVVLTLTNPSTTTSVTNVKLYISPGPYVTPSITYTEIGGLDATASQQTSLTVKASSSASSTTSYIKVKATYYSGSTQYENSIHVPISIKRIPVLQITDVQYLPSLIEPGNKVTLYFNLKNEGDGPANEVKVVLNQTTENFIVGGSPETFVDIVDSKESESISFDLVIDPSVDVGTYSIPVSLEYLDETKTVNYSATKYIGLTISGKYNFIITPSEVAAAPGKSGNVDLEIANAGSQEALYLTVKILPSDPIVQVTPQSKYLGNLESDDYSLEDFTFKVAGTASPGTYPLNVQLNYKDPYGQMYNETFQVDITVSSVKEFAQTNGGGMSTFTIVILLLIVGGIGYFVYRKIRKKKK